MWGISSFIGFFFCLYLSLCILVVLRRLFYSFSFLLLFLLNATLEQASKVSVLVDIFHASISPSCLLVGWNHCTRCSLFPNLLLVNQTTSSRKIAHLYHELKLLCRWSMQYATIQISRYCALRSLWFVGRNLRSRGNNDSLFIWPDFNDFKIVIRKFAWL